MCRSLHRPRKLSKSRSQYDRAVVGCVLATHAGSFSATSDSSTASVCYPLRMVWIPKNIVRRHMHLVQPRYEAVIAAGEVISAFGRI